MNAPAITVGDVITKVMTRNARTRLEGGTLPYVCEASVYRALAMACRRYPLSLMVRFCVS
jgi:hypothetical protein